MRVAARRMARRAPYGARTLTQVPAADFPQHGNGDERRKREPGDAAPTVREDDPGGEKPAHRSSGVTADLKYRLLKAVPAAGGKARHARGFRMEDRRASAHQRRGDEDRAVVRSDRQQNEADEREGHADP